MRARLALGGLAVCAALTAFGCSGGGTVSGALAPPKGAGPATAHATFRITIPIVAGSKGAKRPAYVSPSTRSVTFSGSGIATQTVALVASGPNCPIDGSGTTYTCSAAFDGPIGSSTLGVATYASADGTGSPLSINSVPISIVGGQDNAIGVSLNGVAATLTLAVTGATTLTNGTAATQTATWGAKDAAGNTIVGPGSIVNASNIAIAPALTSADAGGHLTVGTQTGNAWAVAYDGGAISTSKLTLSATGLTSVSASTTIQAVKNGTFSTALTGWFNCYATHAGYSAPVNPSPSPQPTAAQTLANPTPTPLDVSVQTTTPTGTPPPSGSANFALVGAGQAAATTTDAPKGQSGICQSVTVPATGTVSPVLSFALFEGGNDAFTNSDVEVDIYPSSAWASTANGSLTTSAPSSTVLAEDNCYDNLQNNKLYLSSPWGSGTHAPVANARYAWCPYTPGGTAPGGGTISQGGYWYARTYDMSAYAGSTVTLFFGIWRAAAGGTGSAASPAYYNYAYFSDIGVSGGT